MLIRGNTVPEEVEVDCLRSSEDSDEIDSDVLPSDEEEEGGTGEDGGYEETASVREDNEYYMSFLRSVFLDDANSERSATDGDDDEEYNAIEEEEDASSGEENDEDDGYVEVSKKEVQDLVHSSWHAIAEANAASIATDGAVDPNVVITHVLKQLLSGSQDSPDIRFNDIPIENVRQLATRQMSMALQLVIQMLLLSEDRSHCEKLCSKYLMDLSNCNFREDAVRKSALISNQYSSIVDYVKAYHLKTLDRRRKFDPNLVTEESPPTTITHTASAPITRTAVASKFQGVSCFDIPLLQDIDTVFQAVDRSRRAVRSASAVGDALLAHVKALRHMRNEVESILSKWNMRTWKCLMPTECYPLSHDAVEKINPRSLYGRHAFTPAEDDLLLRGIMSVNSLRAKGSSDAIRLGQAVDWEEVKKSYLCSKDSQFLENRVMQLTAPNIPESSKFKRAQCLLFERRQKSIPWSCEEDIQLLQGFQAFGCKWNLIKVYFLPNRTHQQLRLRWRTLVNESPSTGGAKIDGDYIKPVRQFLERLRDTTIGAAGEQQSDAAVHFSNEMYISAEDIEEANLLSESDADSDSEHIDTTAQSQSHYKQSELIMLSNSQDCRKQISQTQTRPPIVPTSSIRKAIPHVNSASSAPMLTSPSEAIYLQDFSADLGSNITNMLTEAMLTLRENVMEDSVSQVNISTVGPDGNADTTTTPKKRWSSIARLDSPTSKRTKSSSLFDSVMSATKDNALKK